MSARGRRSIVEAKRAYPVEEPTVRRGARWLVRLVGSLYLRFALRVSNVRMEQRERLENALRAFYRGTSRLLVIFRHVDTADGPLLIHEVLSHFRPTAVNRQLAPHLYFLHGRDVLNWAGPAARWIFPKLGGIAVTNGHHDPQALRRIREVVETGEHPLAFAPEMQVTYHSYRPGPIAGGAASFARWAHEANPDIPVTIAPLAITYQYATPLPQLLDSILERLRRTVGTRSSIYPESKLTELLMLTGVTFGQIFKLVRLEPPADTHDPEPCESSVLETVRYRLCDALLQEAERLLDLSPVENTLERLFRVRYRCSRLIYRKEDLEKLSILERSILDSQASVAGCADHLQQITDVLIYLDPTGVDAKPTMHRLVEYALTLLDLQNRITGGTIDSRYRPRRRTAVVLAGETINASEVLRREHGREGTRLLNRKIQMALQEGSTQLEELVTKKTRP